MSVNTAGTDGNASASTLTLGELLYANPAITRVTEKEWLALVHAIASGDQTALRILYEKTSPLVLLYLLRVTGERQRAEDLTVDVFEAVWCEAPVFNRAEGPVIGWIMNQARNRALSWARTQAAWQGTAAAVVASEENLTAWLEPRAEVGRLELLEVLTPEEQETIQTLFLGGSSYVDVAQRCGISVGTIKSRIRSGLWKLQQALKTRGNE